MLNRIGLDRFIELSWLDEVASLANKENKQIEEVRSLLNYFLKDRYPSFEARRKTVTVLMRIWLRVTPEIQHMHRAAISLFKEIDTTERIWLHWGKVLIAYPIFRDISSIVGRLISLNNYASSTQIRKRIAEKWGERTSLARATDRVLQSFRAWNVLAQKTHNYYLGCTKFRTNNKDLQLWLIEAVMRSAGLECIHLNSVYASHSVFPFLFNITYNDLLESSVFEYGKQDLNQEILILRNPTMTEIPTSI